MNSTSDENRQSSAPTTGPSVPREVIVKWCGLAVVILAAATLFFGLIASAPSSDAPAPAEPGLAAVPSTPVPSAPTQAAPPIQPQPEVEAGPTVPTDSMRRHTVTPGETLAGIAQRYQVPFELIAADNALDDPDRIVTGQSLAISVPPTNVVVITEGATMTDYATQHGRSVAALAALNPQIADLDHIMAGAGLRVS